MIWSVVTELGTDDKEEDEGVGDAERALALVTDSASDCVAITGVVEKVWR